MLGWVNPFTSLRLMLPATAGEHLLGYRIILLGGSIDITWVRSLAWLREVLKYQVPRSQP